MVCRSNHCGISLDSVASLEIQPSHSANRHDPSCGGAGVCGVGGSVAGQKAVLVAGFFMRGRMGGMQFQTLRFAFSSLCLAASMAVSVFGLRSETTNDVLFCQQGGVVTTFGSSRGVLYVALTTVPGNRFVGGWGHAGQDWTYHTSWRRPNQPEAGFDGYWTRDRFKVQVPCWFAHLLLTVLAQISFGCWCSHVEK